MAPKSKGNYVNLMLDSGVFSAWNRGLPPLSVKEYCAFIKDNRELLGTYVAMDAIPGTFGNKPTQEMVEKSASTSYANLQKMKDAGLTPIPVYHQGERFYWLEKLLKDGEPYIGISSAKDLWVAEQRRWLDEVFSILTDAKGKPYVKTHGFGITRPGFIFRYPFYTIDSTTWSLSAGFGKIFVPVYVDGKPDYLRPPLNVIISGVQQKSASTQKRQFEGMGEKQREVITRYLRDEVGLSVLETRYGTTNRRRALLTYYLRLGEHLTNRRFEDRLGSRVISQLVDLDLSGRKAQSFNLTMMFATSLSREWASLMNEVGATNRLLSYFELKDRPSEVLEAFVKTGVIGKYVKKMPKASWKSEAYRNYRRLSLAEMVERNREPEGPTGQTGDSQPGA